ncbi:UDP-glucose dehydrogenase family protein [Polycladidibacter hongkongensis]|uniref:UDP-glucose dehydrogenase family protein n=1 Tax=Polycladidibacter hongkongensis TaxID=1647556 RepID=UPI00082D8DB8|nr:nucleotide sugar dehydrogenase [Pseudovibrio hongkongensis]
MMPRVSVFGLGKLGAPMLAVFASKGFEVIGVDKNERFVDLINQGISPVEEPQLQELISVNSERIEATIDTRAAVLDSDISFIIVPTPSGVDGLFCNDFVLAAIEEIGSALRAKDSYHLVVVTSTVMPGSTGGEIREKLEAASGRLVGDGIGLCYNPEFIALGSVVRDMLRPDMILIGESDHKAGAMLAELYRSTTESNPEFHRMNFVNAELCKISVNTFVTTKISYANMIAEFCERLDGADVDTVTHALGADTRIGKKYLKGAVAYGGPCFPRDNRAFTALGEKLGANTALAEATDKINSYQTERLLAQILLALDSRSDRVSILGLSYKPNTPVTECSQGLELVRRLSKLNVNVSVSDPVALQNADTILPNGVQAHATIKETICGSAVVVICTAWKDYASLPLLITELAPSDRPRFVIDPWRCTGVAQQIINSSDYEAAKPIETA